MGNFVALSTCKPMELPEIYRETEDFCKIFGEKTLLAMAQAGDETAVSALLRHYSWMVMDRCRSHYLPGDATEDLLQEGMLGLFQAILVYKEEYQVPFVAFAKVIVHRRLLDVIRTANRKKRFLSGKVCSLDALAESDASWLLHQPAQNWRQNPEQYVLQLERVEFLVQQTTQLERRILWMLLLGYSYRETADWLAESTKSVDNALQRVRKKVRRL